MALTYGYATVRELATRFSIGDPLDDPQLEHVLAAVSRRVEIHCRRIFYDTGLNGVTGVALNPLVTARSYVADSGGVIRVDDFSTLTGLVVKTDDGDDGSFGTTWTISTDFQAEPLNGVVDGVPGWPYNKIRAVESRLFPRTARPAVQVTARWGWASIPDAVREATLIQAGRLFKRKDSLFGVAGSTDFGTVSLKNRLDPDVEFLLAPYVKNAVPVA